MTVENKPTGAAPKKMSLTRRKPVEAAAKPEKKFTSFKKPAAPARPGAKRPAPRKPAKPAKPLTAEQLKQLEEKKKKQARIAKTREILEQTFPLAFNSNDVKPLKVDIHSEIFAHFNSDAEEDGSPLKKSAIRTFLLQYIRSDAYNRAAVKLRKRYSLDGRVVAHLTDEEVQYHQSLIKKPKPKARPKGKPGFTKAGAKSGFANKAKTFAPKVYFKAGDQVVFNNKEGVIREVEQGKIKIQLKAPPITLTVLPKDYKNITKK